MVRSHLAPLGAFCAALLAAPLSALSPAQAQEVAAPPPPAEFTFRRVRAPGPDHTGPRITIQIRPTDGYGTPPVPAATPAAATDAEPEASADADAGGAAARAAGPLDWFWSEIAADLPADPQRFWAAQALLSEASEVAALGVPRLGDLHAMAAEHGRHILAATLDRSISPALVLAVMAVESSGRQAAVSSAGAQGLMQLIPDTATRFGVTDAFDPAQNIAGGVAYLDWLMDEFDRDPVLVLAAYNAGEGAVRRAGGVPDYDETRAYVPKVLATWAVTRNLCLTPPELISDGCVFRPISAVERDAG